MFFARGLGYHVLFLIILVEVKAETLQLVVPRTINSIYFNHRRDSNQRTPSHSVECATSVAIKATPACKVIERLPT